MKVSEFKVAFWGATRVIMMAFAIALVTVSCGKDDDDGDGDNTEVSLENSTKAAFQQFGIDLDKVKPNVAAPDNDMLEFGNKVDNTVYYRKATWVEKSETDITPATGNAYNERVFDYIKTVAADKKIYQNITSNGKNPATEIESYDYFADLLLITWSYKYNGMWIDVYPEYKGSGKEIGISMNGSGSY
jgi:hypothetical protein